MDVLPPTRNREGFWYSSAVQTPGISECDVSGDILPAFLARASPLISDFARCSALRLVNFKLDSPPEGLFASCALDGLGVEVFLCSLY